MQPAGASRECSLSLRTVNFRLCAAFCIETNACCQTAAVHYVKHEKGIALPGPRGGGGWLIVCTCVCVCGGGVWCDDAETKQLRPCAAHRQMHAAKKAPEWGVQEPVAGRRAQAAVWL